MQQEQFSKWAKEIPIEEYTTDLQFQFQNSSFIIPYISPRSIN